MASIGYITASGILKPKGIVKTMYKDGSTSDIIKTILYADQFCKADTEGLAPQLKGSTDLQTAKNVWLWVKKNIRYVLDPLGEQYVKAPAVTWKDGFADCKSRSLFQASLLKNLGIKYAYRFAAYKKGDYKHVYIVSIIDGKKYVQDPDMPAFNTEKPTVKHLDKNMSEIVYMAGIEEEDPTVLSLPDDIGTMDDFDMELSILNQRDNIAKGIVENIAGIGCYKAERFSDRADMTKAMIRVMRNKKLSPEQKLNGIGIIAEMIQDGDFDSAKSLSGIGAINLRNVSRKKMHQAKMNKVYTRIKNNHKPKIGKISLKKIVKKAATVVKKTVTQPAKLLVKATKAVTKLALKTITEPAKLAARGVLQGLLPQMAPAFLYLFVKDQKLIDKLPEKARRKRKKSEKLAKFITGALGMKEAHMMGLIRNGIMKKMGKSPETILEGMLKSKISGIGILPAIMAILPVVMKVIKMIGTVFKKKDKELENYSGDDIPDQSDFDDMPDQDAFDLGTDVKRQPDAVATEEYELPAGTANTSTTVEQRTSSADRRTNRVS